MCATVSYTYAQTVSTVCIDVRLHTTTDHTADIDVYISQLYVKLHLPHTLLHLDLLEPIDLYKTLHNKYLTVIPNQYIRITLYKQTHSIWPNLTAPSNDRTLLQQRRQQSIAGRTSYDAEQASVYAQQQSQLQQTLQQQQAQYAQQEIRQIHQLQQAERLVSLDELQLSGWTSNQTNKQIGTAQCTDADTADIAVEKAFYHPQHIHVSAPLAVSAARVSARPTIRVTATFSSATSHHVTARNVCTDGTPVVLSSADGSLHKYMVDAESQYVKSQQYIQHTDYCSANNLLTHIIQNIPAGTDAAAYAHRTALWYCSRAVCYYHMSQATTNALQSHQQAVAAVQDLTQAATLDASVVDQRTLQQYQSQLHTCGQALTGSDAQLQQLISTAVTLYQQQQYADAIVAFSAAIRHCCATSGSADVLRLQQLLSNRAACHLQLHHCAECISDCEQSAALRTSQRTSSTSGAEAQYQLCTQLRLATALAYSGHLPRATAIYRHVLTQLYELDDNQHDWCTAQDKQDLLNDVAMMQLTAEG